MSNEELVNGVAEDGDEVRSSKNLRFVSDFENEAKKKLKPAIFSFIACGADDQNTLENNVSAFKKYTIHPRYFQNSYNVDVSSILFDGRKIRSPIGIAPTCCHAMVHKNGELETVKAAVKAGVPMIVSAVSNRSLEEMASAAAAAVATANQAPVPILWFQVKIFKDRSITTNLIRRAERCGFNALVVGVDWSVMGKRRCGTWNQLLQAVRDPAVGRLPNFIDQPGLFLEPEKYLAPLDWSTIDWLKSVTELPIIFKGVLDARFASEASQHGIAGIIVSNHGGRQLDSLPATIDVLPDIVKAVDQKCDIYLDGGIRCGNSIFKALAMGAKAVFVGRPILYGLAYDGAKGAGRILEILDDELRRTMSLSGFRTLEDLRTADYDVVRRS